MRDVYAALATRQDDVPVTAIMRSRPRVDADGTLADVRAALEEAPERVAAVFEGRRYLGPVGLDDIHEAEAILASCGCGNARRRPGSWRCRRRCSDTPRPGPEPIAFWR